MSKRAGSKRFLGICQGTLEHNCNLCSFTTHSSTGIRLHLKVAHGESIEKSKVEEQKVVKDRCSICGEMLKGARKVRDHIKKVHTSR